MRYLFGKSFSDFVITPPSSAPDVSTTDGGSVSAVVLADPFQEGIVSLTEGGTPISDITDPNEVTISAISTNGDGFLNPFKGPDEVKVLWLSFNGGTTWKQVVSSETIAQAADYVPPLVVIGPAETEPPPGTPAGTLVFRQVF